MALTTSRLFVLGLTTFAACSGEDRDVCDEPGTACVWAGIGVAGFNNKDPNADRLDSKLYFPSDLTFGPDGRAYVSDWNNHRIRRVEKDGSMVVVVGTDYEGDGPPLMDDRLPSCNPAGAPGDTVAMNHMTEAEFGPDGKLYISAWHNNKIRVFDPATNIVTVLGGDGYGFRGDGGPVCTALFNQPKSVAVAPDGTIYVVDQRNVRIRKIATDAQRTITTIAGSSGTLGFDGDGGDAFRARFGFEIGTTPRPSGALALDGKNLYIADSLNNRIRKIDLDTNIIDCVAGKLEPGYSGDGGSALEAQFNFPNDIEMGPDGKLYVADRMNNVIRAIDLANNTVETVVGTGEQCDVGKTECADHVPARQIGLNEPYGLAFDAAGNLYVADTHNSRILRIKR